MKQSSLEENLIKDAKDSEKKKSEVGFEISTNDSSKVTEGLTKLNDLVNHDKPVTSNLLDGISTSLDNIIEELDLEKNLSIWREIREGKFDEEKIKTMTKEISEDIAKVLCKYDKSLNLDGLSYVSDPVALYLAQHKGILTLKGLQKMSDNTAKYFFENRKDVWWLEKLTSISDIGIEYLVKNLSKRDRRGILSLESLPHISDSAAKILATFEGSSITLGVEILSEQAAENLSEFKGQRINLTKMKVLPDEIAKNLAQFEGSINLGGLETLSTEAAKSLTQIQRNLNLRSVTSLSEEAVDYLSKNKGTLTLTSFKNITPHMAESFSKHDSIVDLGITSLSNEIATALIEHKGTMGLTRLVSLSDSLVDCLCKHKGKLYLSWDTIMSENAKEKLTKHGIKPNGHLAVW